MPTLKESLIPPNPKRLLSLDAFRGIAIAGMILVNSSGSDTVYPALEHAEWNGWTPADFVFPSFLVTMGISLAISLGRRVDRGESRHALFHQIIGRTLIIFTLGLIINIVLYDSASGLRVMGVMQRISVCYFFCALFYLAASPHTEAISAGAILIVYWLLLTKVPVPGFGAGDLTPQGNLASYLDRLILGRHLYRPLFDPEGLLSTFPAIATALFGALAGRYLRTNAKHARKAAALLAWGAAGIVAGLIWGTRFPINKHIWTSSYALLTGGIALYVFAVCYWLIETLDLKGWAAPFVIFGRNPLLSYFLSGLFYDMQEFVKMTLPDGTPGNLKLWINERFFHSWLSPRGASLGYDLSYLVLFLGFMAVLHRKKIFLKI